MTTTDENLTTVATQQPATAEVLVAMPSGGQRRSSISGDVVTEIQQTELIEKIRSTVLKFQKDFQVKRPDAREVLQESQAKFNEIMEIINHRIQQVEADRVKLESEIIELRSHLRDAAAETSRVSKQMSALQTEKTTIEEGLRKAAGESQLREQEVANLKSELEKAHVLLEAAVADKNKFEKKNESISGAMG